MSISHFLITESSGDNKIIAFISIGFEPKYLKYYSRLLAGFDFLLFGKATGTGPSPRAAHASAAVEVN